MAKLIIPTDTSQATLGYLLADGTIPLTADWDAGAFRITAENLTADVGVFGIAGVFVGTGGGLTAQNTTDGSSNIVGDFFSGNRATPTNDDSGVLRLNCDDNLGIQNEFARLQWFAKDVTNDSRDGSIELHAMKDDVDTLVLELSPLTTRLTADKIDLTGPVECLTSTITMTGGNIIMADNSITGIDTLTFTDAAGTIASIQNQNLLDKSATESVSGAYTFSDQTSVIGGVTASNLLDKTATEAISGAYTHSALLTLALAGAALDVQNTTAAAGEDQVAIFRSGNKTAGAVNDGGFLSFLSDDDAENQQEFARMRWRVSDATEGAIDAQLHFQVALNSSLTTGLTVSSTGIQTAEGDFTGDVSIAGDLDLSGGPGTIFVDTIDSGTGSSTAIVQALTIGTTLTLKESAGGTVFPKLTGEDFASVVARMFMEPDGGNYYPQLHLLPSGTQNESRVYTTNASSTANYGWLAHRIDGSVAYLNTGKTGSGTGPASMIIGETNDTQMTSIAFKLKNSDKVTIQPEGTTIQNSAGTVSIVMTSDTLTNVGVFSLFTGVSDHVSTAAGGSVGNYWFENSEDGENPEIRFYGFPTGTALKYASLQVTGANQDLTLTLENTAGQFVFSEPVVVESREVNRYAYSV